jgi:hypothetical protein
MLCKVVELNGIEPARLARFARANFVRRAGPTDLNAEKDLRTSPGRLF